MTLSLQIYLPVEELSCELRTHTHTYTLTHAQTCTHMRTHTHTHTHTHAHTHTHTHPPNPFHHPVGRLTDSAFTFITKCIDVIESNSLDEEGLYRKPGQVNKAMKLMKDAVGEVDGMMVRRCVALPPVSVT